VRAGLGFHRSLVVHAPLSEEGGFRAMNALLSLDPRPTAAAVWSLVAAVGALAAAKRQGLRLPEDLSLVTFHDAPLAAYLDPPLTAVRMPLAEMAEEGVDCLLRLVAGERVESVVLGTPPRLVVRGSSAPCPGLTEARGKA
jgi:DNA-binding LacI/PurR family transcriptional regulator